MKRLTRLATPALALAAAIGAPMTVQAAPEFYGRVNVSLDRLSDYPDGSLSGQLNDVQAARSPLEEGWFLESNSSRLGVRGREPLEVGELSVLYQLEVGYDVDGDSDTFSTRNSFVGLGSVIGDVFAGRYDSPVKMAEGRVDQFNNTAADIGGYFFGQRRNSNTLNWKSPDFSGLVVRAQLAPGEGDSAGDEEKDGLADTFGLSATWSGETLFAALAYEHGYQEVDNPAPPPALDAQAGDQAGGGAERDDAARASIRAPPPPDDERWDGAERPPRHAPRGRRERAGSEPRGARLAATGEPARARASVSARGGAGTRQAAQVPGG